MIHSIQEKCVLADRWGDRAPIISTGVSLATLVFKCLQPLIAYFSKYLACLKSFTQAHFIQHLTNKPFSRCLTLLLPFVGNILIYQSDERELASHRKKAAKKYYETAMGMKDSPEKVALLKKTASLNHGGAMNLLGIAYQEGKGVEKDEKVAFEYFKMSAKEKNSNGLHNLSMAYLYGTGTTKDFDLAEKHLLEALDAGSLNSLDFLGYLYQEKKDFQGAFAWYMKGAELGIPRSMNSVGLGYLKGIGTTKDLLKAEMYLKKAASCEYILSYKYLGDIYMEKRNPRTAYEWYKKSAEKGNQESKKILETFKKSW